MKTYLHYLAYKIKQDWKENKEENITVLCLGSSIGVSIGACFIILLTGSWIFMVATPVSFALIIYGLLRHSIKEWLSDERENFREWRNQQ